MEEKSVLNPDNQDYRDPPKTFINVSSVMSPDETPKIPGLSDAAAASSNMGARGGARPKTPKRTVNGVIVERKELGDKVEESKRKEVIRKRPADPPVIERQTKRKKLGPATSLQEVWSESVEKRDSLTNTSGDEGPPD